MHPNNKFNQGYLFKNLIKVNPKLKEFVIINKFNQSNTINFANPQAVKELNKALLFTYPKISVWHFPDTSLCPPIPSRLDYIHYLSDLLSSEKDIKILDIGTGASCIYPFLGVAEYNWNFVATDIDINSLDFAQDNIDDNGLSTNILLRHQTNPQQILKGVVENEDFFTATMCNPPFYKSAKEAQGANRRKTRNLGNLEVRNFSGNANELWFPGGEKAFLHNYLYESSLFKKSSKWFTSLVSKKDNVNGLKESATKLGTLEFKVIPVHQGSKISRIVCWRF